MKKPIVFLSFFVALLLTSCTSTPIHDVICKAEDQIVLTGTAAVAAALQCKGTAAISADIRSVVEKVQMCTPTEASDKKKISPFICGLIADLAVNQIGKTIPARYECSPTAASATLKTVLITACSAIPGI